MKPLITIIIIAIGSLVIAQPAAVSVSGCTMNAAFNDTFTKSNSLINNAPCYVASGTANLSLELDMMTGVWGFGQYPNANSVCSNGLRLGFDPLTTDGPVDVTQASINGSTLCNLMKVSEVPTLGQWGILILAFFLVIMAVNLLMTTDHKNAT